MHLNHMNLCVPDIAAVEAFFEKYFGFEVIERRGDNLISILRGDGDFVLVLSNFEKKDRHEYPRDFHVGFHLGSPEDVWAVYRRMKDDGVELDKEPRNYPHGTSFYGHIDKTILFEIGSRA